MRSFFSQIALKTSIKIDFFSCLQREIFFRIYIHILKSGIILSEDISVAKPGAFIITYLVMRILPRMGANRRAVLS